jgi:formyltetrahydrofolate-dependent phosphoribosylglycinamide formyltransferase
MQNFRIAVMASTNGTDLGAIIEEMKTGLMPGIELVKVVSNVEDCGALEKARAYDLFLGYERTCEAIFVDSYFEEAGGGEEARGGSDKSTVEHEKRSDGVRVKKKRADYDAELVKAVGEVDLVCLIGYMRILTPVFVNAYAGRIINVHPSLLPKYGGKGMYGSRVHEAVLEAGEKETGMTIHMVDEEVDHGKVLMQKTVTVEDGDDASDLKRKVMDLEKKAYPEVIRMLAEKARSEDIDGEEEDEGGDLSEADSKRNAYLIKHNRPDCIGCTACAAIAPKFWTMSDEDGKSDIIGAKMTEEGWEELEISEKDFKLNMDAAEACPVNVIHLIRIGDGKDLI